MSNLFLGTFSQGLQAFMPIAAALAWCDAYGVGSLSSAIRRALVLSIPASFLAAWLFRVSARQPLDEALLALAALIVIVLFDRMSAESDPRARSASRRTTITFWTAAGCACLIVVRQTMVIVATLGTAAVELRSFDPTATILATASLTGLIAWLWSRLVRRLPAALVQSATRTFLALFFIQGLMYALHKSAEARLLPWSEAVHAATEPYGPDGLYGLHFSDLLVLAPLIVVARLWMRNRVSVVPARRSPAARHRAAMGAATLAFCMLMSIQHSDARLPQAEPGARAADLARLASRPHVLFRHTATGPDFGKLAIAPLDTPDRERQFAALTCERLSFANGRGLCLHLQRGVFNTYTAFLLDNRLATGASIKLQGLPSRTRTAADGRVGAVTVFVTGDNYATDFSTRTTIIDLAGGDQIGDLEEFSVWRGGQRFRAEDFNFWGVTFANDGNTFYAALRSAGSTYLVRGELALRRLTVMRENVECPSLSPDNRLLAYKKRVGPSPDSWRLHVLDLKTNVERPIAGETRAVDDQVEWLDAGHLLYGVRRRTTSISDVWMVAIDEAQPSRVFIAEAESPIVVR